MVPTMFARIGVTGALNRRVERVFNSDRKEHHWGQRKLPGSVILSSNDIGFTPTADLSRTSWHGRNLPMGDVARKMKRGTAN